MGQSTNAILFYGYCWDDEDVNIFVSEEEDTEPEVEPEDVEWPERVLLSRGMTNPWKAYPSSNKSLPYEERRKASEKWCADHRAELDAWSKAKDRVEKEFGVELDSHCSGECPMPFICIPKSKILAYRGDPKKVEPTHLTVDPEWDAKLDHWMKTLGVERPQKAPRWWLVSYWN